MKPDDRRPALVRLFQHVRWADGRVLESLEAAPAVSPDTLALYAHILGAEHVWLARLKGVAPRVAVWPDLSVEACAALARENHAGYLAFVDDLPDGEVDRAIAYVNSAGAAFRSTIEDILLQVVLHGSYHRGQIARDLRAAGAEPRPTDYIAFVRGAPAATRRGT